LAKIFEKANQYKNLNLVGGSPTPQLPFILDALNRMELKVPVVWNSNFFMSEKAMDLLKGVIDVYLSDWKYGNSACGEKYSGVKNYWETISRNHLKAFRDRELVIRHLLLPNNFECCTKPFLEFVAKNFGKKVVVNLMDQYRPEFNARGYPEISGWISGVEFSIALGLAKKLGLEFIF
jgi:putative pyruvate formate lyase activating enzyme